MIHYLSERPKYQFLDWCAARQGVLCHGSPNLDIGMFQPRPQTDYAQRVVSAVFATDDGIWPIFFAILRRDQPGSLRNDFIDNGDGTRSYHFSVTKEWLPDCFGDGMIYLLPRKSFNQVDAADGTPSREWASAVPVRPLARLPVSSSDFPLLAEVRGHDDSEARRVIELLKEFLNDGPVEIIDGGIELRRPVAALSQMREFIALNDETGVLAFPTELQIGPDHQTCVLTLLGGHSLQLLVPDQTAP